jgi:hypothetical protein
MAEALFHFATAVAGSIAAKAGQGKKPGDLRSSRPARRGFAELRELGMIFVCTI